MSVASQLIEHVTSHTGLVFDKHRLDIEIRSIYMSLETKIEH